MAFMAKILSKCVRHLNIVAFLLKRRPTKGGGDHGHPSTPLAMPLSQYSQRTLPDFLGASFYLQKVTFLFFPTDFVNTKTTQKIPLRVGSQR